MATTEPKSNLTVGDLADILAAMDGVALALGVNPLNGGTTQAMRVAAQTIVDSNDAITGGAARMCLAVGKLADARRLLAGTAATVGKAK